jgi:hypothetical protein
MAKLTVSPETFTMVLFDADEIRSVGEELIDRIGLPDDLDIRLEIDEPVPLGRMYLTVDGRSVLCKVEGGAFEDPKRPRRLSPGNVQNGFGRLLLRVRDMLDPAFGTPPADGEMTLAERVAWDTYSEGRLDRLGYSQRQPRRRYHFRMRHGFTDVADRVFERLWAADSLTWSDIAAACVETTAATPAA